MGRRGRMRVILTVHGGHKALADVMDGLVQRNARAIAEGVVPPLGQAPARVRQSALPVWRDALTALTDGTASRGTLAAWEAAGLRARGQPATVGFIGGRATPILTQGGSVTVLGFGGVPDVLGVGTKGRYAPSSGVVVEDMLLTLDDDWALPVREINNAIGRHNAKQIVAEGLPRLYLDENGPHVQTGGPIRYRAEGSPELWWDAKQIALMGFDDCEGLAAYRMGELLNEGHDASVYTRYIETPAELGGGRLFHAITQVAVPDGAGGIRYEYDDPSVRLGMPVPEWYKEYCRGQRAFRRPL